MIIVELHRVFDENTGLSSQTATHGVDTRTGDRVALPSTSLEELGAVYSSLHHAYHSCG